MKHLSYWAKHHPLQARALIVAAHTLAATAAFKTGIWLYARHDVAWLIWLFPLLLALTVWVKSAYPAKPKLPESSVAAADHRYWRSRRVLFGMTLCGWLLVLLAGNRTAEWAEQPEASVGRPDAVGATTERSPAAYGQTSFLMIDGGQAMQAKAAFKWLKTKKKAYFQKKIQRIRQRSAHAGDEGLDVAVQVLLTLLTLGLASFLAFLVAWVSCSLSCSGQEGLAIAVLLIGGGLIIWGLVAALIAIWRANDSGIPAPPGEPIPKRPPSKRL